MSVLPTSMHSNAVFTVVILFTVLLQIYTLLLLHNVSILHRSLTVRGQCTDIFVFFLVFTCCLDMLYVP